MKFFLFGITALILMVSCGGKGEEKTITSDSSAIIDTAIQTGNGIQDEKKDNIQNSENNLKQINDDNDSKEILAALPDPKRLLREANPTKYLRSLGFKGSYKTEPTVDGDRFVGKYSFEAGNKSITVRWKNLMGSDGWDVTIKNDNKALENYYSKAKKQQGRGEYWEVVVKKKGNTVKIYSNSD